MFKYLVVIQPIEQHCPLLASYFPAVFTHTLFRVGKEFVNDLSNSSRSLFVMRKSKVLTGFE